MVLNTIKLSLGSLFLCLVLTCTTSPKSVKNKKSEKRSIDTCRYNKYHAREIMTGLGCNNCHTQLGSNRFKDISTFSDISSFDSIKMVDFTFKKRHMGWYDKNLKSARMDTLSECEVKSVIRYIKDYNRDLPPMPSQ